MADLPDGIELQYARYGEPANSNTAMVGTIGAEPAPSYAPYVDPAGDRTKKCIANDNTCNGWRLKDSEFCPGHAGVLKPGGGRLP